MNRFILPNIASINTAKKPTDSMNQVNGSIKYVMIAPTNHTASIKSKKDWKSVHAQKYFGSKSKRSKRKKTKRKTCDEIDELDWIPLINYLCSEEKKTLSFSFIYYIKLINQSI